MTVIGKVRTPRGKHVSVKQYVALANKHELPCEHGHLSCAAWAHGPCSDELLSALESKSTFPLTEQP